ncbi:calcium-translocating P-type ATPase, PMCA-type family protein [Histomonas meleagridis]|uniref:calcium-translocating P-type ATPase, PMCA-type family protein n=1 Tax=Histomonas meleagridis TaxID=135588 RepID=UPI003559C334|nr:calcium-translocating P-type ATPase, PMCA-type family protein [Histomonas meleagridis]KAH0806340.1 calcium-translocating P-type ATPase, PMCA-type family protein [Histomonas meleagridis]
MSNEEAHNGGGDITTESILNMFERNSSKETVDRFLQSGGIQPYLNRFKTDLKNGLPDDEQFLEERRREWGENKLPPPPTKSWCRMFIKTFEDLMLKILIVSAIVSLILTSCFPEGGVRKIEDYIDTIAIFIAVLIVSCVQATTNYSQQKSFQEINKLKNEYNVAVLRGGIEKQILNTEVVAGDILNLKNGDKVCADGLYISGNNLKVNNSQETGESDAIAINERNPFVLGGGAVELGDAKILIVAVGQNSQSGKRLLDIQQIGEEAGSSPLEKKLDKVAIMLTNIGLGGALLTFFVLLIYWIENVVDLQRATGKFEGSYFNDLVQKFMIGVTIFICAVPEGLPLAVTIALGFSMKKMMKDKNFVRHLQACETMGGATTICSDKTGTLTENKMTVVKFAMDGQEYGRQPDFNNNVKSILFDAICHNTTAKATMVHDEKTDQEKIVLIGSSSECALLNFVKLYGVDFQQVRDSNPKVHTNEFTSARKKMSTIVMKDGHGRSYVKGAPDFVLRTCTHYMKFDGNIEELDEGARQRINSSITSFADQSLRTMLIAYTDLQETEMNPNWEDPDYAEQNLCVIGLVGIEDPLRPEVKGAIEQCNRARVIVRMVTGDYINTAKAISKQCGILKEEEGHFAMLGEEFAKKSKLELIDDLPNLRVLARSSPSDKLRLVQLLMESGEVVAVTGDGSNDSPALKQANVGLSMGMCGTELAKMASDIVILDDNFNSIVSALKWGRCIYDNVRSFLQFQLTVNFAALIIAFVGSCVLHNSPLKTIQLLWVNLIMDSLGALALATRGPSDALLNRPPYGESDGLISNVLARNIVGHVVYQTIVLFLILFGDKSIFKINESDSDIQERHVSTLVFNTFVYMQVFNLINARVANQDMTVLDGLFSNIWFIIIFVGIAGLQAILVIFAKSAFLTVDLSWKEWLISIGLGAGSLVIGVLLRLIKLPDMTVEKLEKLRAEKKEEIKRFYANVPGQDQWKMSTLKKKKEESDDESD